MISRAAYDKIAKKWKGKVYQKYNRLKRRISLLEEHIEFFKGTSVLELGCNAGMYAWHLAPYTIKYTGLEADKHYIEQAKCTARSKDLNCTWMYDKLECIEPAYLDYDTFLASYVLHHLNEKEIQILEDMFKVCTKVAIMTRSGDPLQYGHDQIGQDPLPYWNDSIIKKMLDSLNYGNEFYYNKYNGVYLILAEKR